MFFLILLYVVMTLIRPQDYLGALADMPVMPVLIALALMAWLASSKKNLKAPQYLLLAAFTLVSAASIAANGWVGGAWQQLLNFAPTLVAFVVMANALDSERRIHLMMMVFVLCATVLAWHGVYQLDHDGVGWTGALLSADRRIQYVGIFHDPNDLGTLFVMVLPMAFYLMRRQGGGFPGRVLWLACAVLLVYGIYLTKSRGAMLALVAMFGIYLWRRRGTGWAIVLGVAALALMRIISPRMDELTASESSAFGRVDSWYAGLHMFLSNPLFGVGTNNFTEHNYLTAHNSFVLVLAENGIVGYTLWLAFVGYGLWMALTVVRFRPAAEWLESVPGAVAQWKQVRAMGMSMLLAQCGFLVAAFFLSRSYVIILYMMEAIVVSYYVHARQQVPDLPRFKLSRDLLRWPLLALASVATLFIVVRLLLLSA